MNLYTERRIQALAYTSECAGLGIPVNPDEMSAFHRGLEARAYAKNHLNIEDLMLAEKLSEVLSAGFVETGRKFFKVTVAELARVAKCRHVTVIWALQFLGAREASPGVWTNVEEGESVMPTRLDSIEFEDWAEPNF